MRGPSELPRAFSILQLFSSPQIARSITGHKRLLDKNACSLPVTAAVLLRLRYFLLQARRWLEGQPDNFAIAISLHGFSQCCTIIQNFAWKP
jgi:hypothetical protein